MKRFFSFNLTKIVAASRSSFEASRASYVPPVITNEMKALNKKSIESAKVIRELTDAEYERLDQVLSEAKKSPNLY